MQDYTGAEAHQRVFYVNLLFLRYGTNDKTHAAALILSFVLLVATVATFASGYFVEKTDWAEGATRWFGSSFLFVAGVAIGKGGREGGEKGD